MAATGHTDYLHLPQWEVGNVTNWFELNTAFETIDQYAKENQRSSRRLLMTADPNSPLYIDYIYVYSYTNSDVDYLIKCYTYTSSYLKANSVYVLGTFPYGVKIANIVFPIVLANSDAPELVWNAWMKVIFDSETKTATLEIITGEDVTNANIVYCSQYL